MSVFYSGSFLELWIVLKLNKSYNNYFLNFPITSLPYFEITSSITWMFFLRQQKRFSVHFFYNLFFSGSFFIEDLLIIFQLNSNVQFKVSLSLRFIKINWKIVIRTIVTRGEFTETHYFSQHMQIKFTEKTHSKKFNYIFKVFKVNA